MGWPPAAVPPGEPLLRRFARCWRECVTQACACCGLPSVHHRQLPALSTAAPLLRLVNSWPLPAVRPHHPDHLPGHHGPRGGSVRGSSNPPLVLAVHASACDGSCGVLMAPMEVDARAMPEVGGSPRCMPSSNAPAHPATFAAAGRRLEARCWASSTEQLLPWPQQQRYRMELKAAAAVAGAAGRSRPAGVATAAARVQRASAAITAGAAGPLVCTAGWL